MNPQQARPRVDQLDALRGVLALVVVFYHFRVDCLFRSVAFVRHGYLMVDFFFVLSGFVMFYNYPRFSEWGRARSFFIARFFRLYPLHVLMLMVFLAYELAQWILVVYFNFHSNNPPFSENNALAFVLNLLLLNGVGILDHPTFNGPSWSISAEFLTYILFGFLVLLGRHNRTLLLLGFALLCTFAGVLLASDPSPSALNQIGTYAWPRCVLGFFLGAVLCAVIKPAADVSRSAPDAARFSRVAACLQVSAMVLAVLAVTYLAHGRWELFIPFVYALVIAVLVRWNDTPVVRFLKVPPLQWLGKHSYTIYMTHDIFVLVAIAAVRIIMRAPSAAEADSLEADGQPVQILMIDETLGTILCLACVAVVLAIAPLVFRFIEEPARLFGKRIAAGRAATLPGQTPSKALDPAPLVRQLGAREDAQVTAVNDGR